MMPRASPTPDGTQARPIMPAPRDAPRAWPLARRALRGTLAALAAAIGLYAVYVLLGPKFHTVIPGRVFRCAQPSPARLESLVRHYGIRTVLNLRGVCETLPCYIDECLATNRLGLSQEDLGLSANRLPSAQCLRELVEVLERSEYPVLLHCNKGAD